MQLQDNAGMLDAGNTVEYQMNDGAWSTSVQLFIDSVR